MTPFEVTICLIASIVKDAEMLLNGVVDAFLDALLDPFYIHELTPLTKQPSRLRDPGATGAVVQIRCVARRVDHGGCWERSMWVRARLHPNWMC